MNQLTKAKRWLGAATALTPLVMGLVPTAHALNRPEFLIERPKKTRSTLQYQYHFYTSTENPEQTIKNFGILKHQAGARIPVTQSETSSVIFQPRATYSQINTDAKVPGRTTLIPKKLGDYEFSLQLLSQSKNQSALGATLELGSASDTPLKDSSVLAYESTLFLRTAPTKAKGDGFTEWVYYLEYSNNRPFLNRLPLPGVGYHFQPDAKTDLLLGFPGITVDTKLFGEFGCKVRAFWSRQIKADLNYTLSGTERLSLGGSWALESYMRHDRPIKDDRLIVAEKRATLELIGIILPELVVSVGGGYVFGRTIHEGKSMSDQDRGQLNIKPALVGTVGVQAIF